VPFSDRQRNVAVIIRSSLDASNLTAAVRSAAREIDPSIVTYEVATMSQRVSRAIERTRFASWMMALFAGLALTLASIGLYGVMAYTVRRRTRELGVRIALGASPGEVAAMVVRRGMLLVAIGISLGFIAALALTRILNTLLFGVSSLDPLTFLGVAAILGSVALAACCIPARRASRIDPIHALRQD
jgi:putative ABC transport system permease protein